MRRSPLLNIRSNRRRRMAKTKERVRIGLARLFRLGYKAVLGVSVMLLFSALLIMGFQGLALSSYFELREVETQGLERLSKKDLLKIAGLDGRVSLLTVIPPKIEQSLKNSPWIEEAKIRRQFPDKVLIAVVERRPVALLNIGELYYLDREGRPFFKPGLVDNSDLPVLTAGSKEDFRAGVYKDLVAMALNLLEYLKGRAIYLKPENITEIRLDPDTGLSVLTVEPRILVFLGFGQLNMKTERFEKIAQHMDREGQLHRIQKVDLNNPSRVVVSLIDLGGSDQNKSKGRATEDKTKT
ncbi:MAG: FtsQ-type POTRA domain-containing protein [Deltaproteobacteria bacterium]|nr:FtsQ-type POTRA domain-containing protein [Deltaproteobacteria bacterium]